MPVKVPDGLPAVQTLAGENIFVMTQTRSKRQDIRPLRIAILNLMPTKESTETQLLRLIGNTPLQIEPALLRTATYEGSNTAREHLQTFYRTLDEVRGERFDGLIITGAPVEQLNFDQVRYWDELRTVMAWADTHVYSTLFICWAAQAALFHYYGIEKHPLPRKMFGVFAHRVCDPRSPLLRGFDDSFAIPVSRHTTILEDEVRACPHLRVLAVSGESGVGLAVSLNGRRVFATGHSEYDPDTLAAEYWRDVEKGLDVAVPRHYYPGDDPQQQPLVSWRGHANLLFQNWLNYYVYQETPYDLAELDGYMYEI
ncbi:MAG: homoserine O-succinyltransferase [Oscillospiraceae bacterium]|jgi:homoserine O-succinyltransferase|nr:homoserine O-succinyltransferase [Oscillospiraceae bacterium]